MILPRKKCVHLLCTKISSFILNEKYDEKNIYHVKINYAMEVLFMEITQNMLLLFLFAITNKFLDALVCMLVLTLLRRFVGGTHMRTSIGCLIISFVVLLLVIVASQCIFIPEMYIIVLAIGYLALIVFEAPISFKEHLIIEKSIVRMKMKALVCELIVLIIFYCLREYREQVIYIILVQLLDSMIGIIRKAR